MIDSLHLTFEDPIFMRFVTNVTDLESEDYYDYIIVGGGTAGCPLAATLSQSFRVLLLERGSVPYTRPNVMTHDGFLTTLTDVNSFDSPKQCDQRWVLQQS
uniref:Glucose-methanol-choline oxidoreductase N-terminal domain-containing protein n=1 Tax=Brassica campestris TaxID=3711 RepID=M4FBA7_BRACM